MIEEKIDTFRNRLVASLVSLLRLLGANDHASVLWRANSRFECPICRLIRAMREKNQALARRLSAFCAECREWPHRICRAVWQCIGAVLQVQIFQSQLAFISLGRIWLPQKLPIYLRKKALRN